MTEILDACCGGRMFWFDKDSEGVCYMDNRKFDGFTHYRYVCVNPDVVADFRDMPFADEIFYHVVFDPPHLLRAGETSWLNVKYGKLNFETWQEDLRKGFAECWRVLKPGGTLVFKWNEDQIKIGEVIPLFPGRPLYGHQSGKSGKTHWVVFYKPVKQKEIL